MSVGILSSLAFDPANVPGAMIVGVAGLLFLLLKQPAARNRLIAAMGAAFGLGFMAPLIWWMNAVSHGAYAVLVLTQIPFFALLAIGLRAVMRLRWWPLWGMSVWVGIEYFRSSFPFSGFPWGRLAHTSIDTPFESYARLVGVAGTSAVMFAVSAVLAQFAQHRSFRRGAIVVLATTALLGLGAALPVGISGPQASREVALVQGDVPGLFGTWRLGEILTKHVAETDKLIAEIKAGQRPQPDFVLWPENATDLDPHQYPAVAELLDRLVSQLRAPLLVGGIFNGPTSTTAYNAGVVWDENGPGARYVKRKPVPYGEYVPFRDTLGGLVPRFDRDIPRNILAGKKSGALRIAGVTIGDSLCWDIAYDGVIRDNINHGAQVLVVQTSNASFTGTSQPAQQWKISRLRAVETGRYVLVPSTNGISGVVGPDGKVIAKAATQTPAIVSARIQLAAGITPGVRFGGILEAVLVALGLLGLIVGSRRGTKVV